MLAQVEAETAVASGRAAIAQRQAAARLQPYKRLRVARRRQLSYAGGGTFDELPEETQLPEFSQFDAFSSLTPSNGSLMEELTKPIMVESQDD